MKMTIMIRTLNESDIEYKENDSDYEMRCYDDETDDYLSECELKGKATEYVYYNVYTQCPNIL